MQAAIEAGNGTALAGLDTWVVVEASVGSAAVQALHGAVGQGFDAVLDAIMEEGLRSVGSFVVSTRTADGFRVIVRGSASAHVADATGVVIGPITAESGVKWTERMVVGDALTLDLPSAAEAPGSRRVLPSDGTPASASRVVVEMSPAPVAPVETTAIDVQTTVVDSPDDGDLESSSFDSFFMPTMQGRPSLAHLSAPPSTAEVSEGASGAAPRHEDEPTAVMATSDPGRTLMPGEHFPLAGGVGGTSPGPQPSVAPQAQPSPAPDFRPAPPPPPIPSWNPPPAAHSAPTPAGKIIDAVPGFEGWGMPTDQVAPHAPEPSPVESAQAVPPPPPHSAPPSASAWQPQPPAPATSPASGPTSAPDFRSGHPQLPPSPAAYAGGAVTAAPAPWTPNPGAHPAPDPNRTVNRGAVRAGAGGATQAAPPQVQAAQCAAGHLSPAHAAVCRVCRIPMPVNPGVFWTPRPVLGRLVCSNGEVFVLDRGIVLGRAPVIPEGHQGDAPNLVKLVDPTLELSSQHLEIRLDHWLVLAVDLGSTNGSDVRAPGRPPVRLVPGVPELLEPGAVVSLADVLTLTFEVW